MNKSFIGRFQNCLIQKQHFLKVTLLLYTNNTNGQNGQMDRQTNAKSEQGTKKRILILTH